MPREREVKLRIAEREGFERLLAALADRGVRRQTNVYFDTHGWELTRAGCSVRVRLEDERVVLTVKRAAAISAGVIESSEHEAEIPSALWRQVERGERPLSDAAAHLPALDGALGGRQVREIARLANTRHLREGPTGALYEIDETRFPWGETHFELEIECDDPASELDAARALLDRLGVAYDDAVSTKQARLFRGLRRPA